MLRLYQIALLLIPLSAPAQSWVKVANEGDTVTATATVRYGFGASWKQLSVSGPIKANNATFGDPIPGTVKELDVMETATPQQVTVNGKAITVPANGTNYSITCTALNVPNPPDPTVTYPATCKAVKQ